MQYTAKEIARLVKGTVEGDENTRVWQPCKIEEGCEGGITFLGNPKYTHYIYEKQSSIVIVRHDFQPEQPVGSTLIRVDNPYMAVAKLLHIFNQRSKPPKGRSWRSSVGRGTKLGKGCYMGPYAVVGRHCRIGNDVKIYPNATIGDNVTIGDGTIVYAGAKVYEGVEIGRNCILHAGCVIGADGFGFAPDGNGGWDKIDQIGNVILEPSCTPTSRWTTSASWPTTWWSAPAPPWPRRWASPAAARWAKAASSPARPASWATSPWATM